MSTAVAIITLITVALGVVSSIIGYKVAFNPRKRYEAKQTKIYSLVAEIDQLMADGGNANAYAVKRKREEVKKLYEDLEQLRKEIKK